MLAGSYADAVAFMTGLNSNDVHCNLSTVTGAGWNPRTGAQLWSREIAGWSGSTRGSILADRLTGGSDADGNPCTAITGIGILTGADLFGYRSADHPTNGNCDRISAVAYPGSGAAYPCRAQHSRSSSTS